MTLSKSFLMSVARNLRAVASVSMVSVLVSGFFVSTAQAAITTINLVSPEAAGLEWRGNQAITWNGVSDNSLDEIDITYASDGINFNQVIATNLLFSAGTYSWDTTLFGDTSTARVRISPSGFPLLGDSSTNTLSVDNTDPTTSIALAPAAPNGIAPWYITTPTVTLSCSDTLSGCLAGGTQYRWDGGSWNTYTVPFNALEGTHTLEWYSEDQAVDVNGDHNVEAINSQVINVDTTFPTVAVTSVTSNGFYNAGDVINVTLTFSEAVSSDAPLLVTFDTAGTCSVPMFSGQTSVSCDYTVASGENTADLTVASLTGATVEDVAGNDSTLVPTSNLAATSDIVVDTTAPAAFVTGSVTITGGNVVALWWNSTNTGADVVVPVANDSSLTGGTIQLQAEADGSFENIGAPYTILLGDLGNTVTIALTAAEIEALTGFTDTDGLTFRSVITDNAGNATTGSDSANTFTVDQTVPTVDAGTDKEVNAMVAQDATTSDAVSGLATYSWTQFSGSGVLAFGTPAAEDTTIAANLDGVYVARLTVTDAAGNTAFDDIDFAWDTTAPVIAEVTPVPTPTNDTTPDYTFSVDSIKQLAASTGGAITYGGTCSSLTTSASVGNNTVTFGTLADAVHNTCTITVADAAGNTSAVLNITAFEVDTVVATVSTITTTDADLDGEVDTATIVFTDEVKDSTFVASDFSIGGVAATTFSTDASDDNTITVSHGGVAGTNAKTVAYVPGTTTDLAGNTLGAFSQTSTDAAGPILLSAITTSVTTLNATFSEDLNGATVNASGSEFTVAGTVVSAATESAPGVVTLTYSALGTGAEPLVTFTSATFQDLNGVNAPSPQSVTAVDGVAPVLTVVSIVSDNTTNTLAKAGDTVTLTFTSSETITTPTVLIQGVAATVDAPVGNNWTAHRVMTGGDTQGAVGLSIAFADDALPTPNTGTTVTAVTDASSVFFDSVNPSVNAGSDKEVNALVAQDATVSDPVPTSGIASYAWTQTSGPGTVTFGTPATEDTTLVANVDGTYVLTLTVTDNAGNVASDTMTFIWDTTNPEPLTAVPSNGTTGIALAAGTATVEYDEDIVLLDGSRVLLVNDANGTSYKGAVSVQGGNGASPILNIDYTGLSFGTTYRINVKPNALEDVAGNNLASNFISYFTTILDTVAPVVNSLSAGSISTTGATLSVTTDESATCRYSTSDSAFASMTAFDAPNTGTSHTVVLAGLTPSTGYDYYVRCQDTTAQTNTMTVSAHVSFTTLTPDTTAPEFTNIQAIGITQTAATITWNTDEAATSRVEYGLTSGYGSFTAVDVTADNTTHSVGLSGLTPGMTYHFRVLSTDAQANSGASVDGTFTTNAPDPDLTAPGVPVITTSVATVNADAYTISGTAAADMPTDTPRTISVYNGATLVGATTVPVGQTVWSLSVTLDQNTTNSFTAVSADAAGNSSAASTAVVITEDENVGADLTAPAVPVFSTTATTVDADTYEVAGSVTDDGGVRIITLYKNGVPAGTAVLPGGETSWAITVALDQDTTNSFTAIASDEAGNVSAASTAVVVTEATVADTSAPATSNIQATGIAQTTATITWDTNEMATSLVEYGLTSAYGSMTTIDALADNTTHSVGLSGLLAGTTYHFRVVSADALGNMASSTDGTFTTAIDDTASLAVTSIDSVQSFATADDTFTNGWKWTFNVTVPTAETTFRMKFADFVSGANSIPAASNFRYYSAQSSDAFDGTTAISITAANTYGADMTLATDLESGIAGRQIEVIVEVKVPVGSVGGSYSTSYGVQSV